VCILDGFDLAKGQQTVAKVFGVIEGWLSKSPFIVGENPTIADIACYCEIDQLELLQLVDFSPFPNIRRWSQQMKVISPKSNAVMCGLLHASHTMCTY
jgi:glutathione S-transferase